MGERFRAYLDDELEPAERAALDAQMAASPELAAEFEDYRRTVELLRALPLPEPPERFAERVEGRIRRRSHGRWFALEPRLRLPYEAIATVALLATMALLLLHVAPPLERPQLLGRCGDATVSAELDRVEAALAPWGELVAGAECWLGVTVPAAQAPAFREAFARDWPAWEAEPVGEPGGALRFVVRPRPQ
jgi:anti-sigma factor RsiW